MPNPTSVRELEEACKFVLEQAANLDVENRNQVETLEKQIGKLSNENENLVKSRAKCEDELNQAIKLVDQQKEYICRLQRLVRRKEESLVRYQDEFRQRQLQANETIAGQTESIKQFKSQIEALTSQHEKQNAKHRQELNLACRESQRRLEKISEELESEANERAKIEVQLHELKESSCILESELKSSQDEVTQLREKSALSENELREELGQVRKNHSEHIAILKQKLSKSSSQLYDANKKLLDQSEQAKSLEQTLQSLRGLHEEMQQDHKVAMDDLTQDLWQLRDARTKEIGQLNQEVESLQKKVNLDNQLHKEAKLALENQIDEKTQQYEVIMEELTTTTEKLTLETEKHKLISEKMLEMEKTLKLSNENLEKLEQERGVYSQKCEVLQHQVDSLTISLEQKDSFCSELQLKVQGKESELLKVSRELERSLQEKEETYRTSVEKLKLQHKSESDALLLRAKELESKQMVSNNQVEKLQQQLTTMTESLENTQLEKDEEYQQTLEELEQKCSRLSKHLSEVQNENQSLKANIVRSHENQKVHKDRMQTYKQEISTLKESITQQLNEFRKTKEKLETRHKSDIRDVQERLHDVLSQYQKKAFYATTVEQECKLLREQLKQVQEKTALEVVKQSERTKETDNDLDRLYKEKQELATRLRVLQVDKRKVEKQLKDQAQELSTCLKDKENIVDMKSKAIRQFEDEKSQWQLERLSLIKEHEENLAQAQQTAISNKMKLEKRIHFSEEKYRQLESSFAALEAELSNAKECLQRTQRDCKQLKMNEANLIQLYKKLSSNSARGGPPPQASVMSFHEERRSNSGGPLCEDATCTSSGTSHAESEDIANSSKCSTEYLEEQFGYRSLESLKLDESGSKASVPRSTRSPQVQDLKLLQTYGVHQLLSTHSKQGSKKKKKKVRRPSSAHPRRSKSAKSVAKYKGLSPAPGAVLMDFSLSERSKSSSEDQTYVPFPMV